MKSRIIILFTTWFIIGIASYIFLDRNIFSDFLVESILIIFLIYGVLFLFSKKFRKKMIPDELVWQANARASNLGFWIMIIMSLVAVIWYKNWFLPESDLQKPEIIIAFIVFPTILVMWFSYEHFLKNPINKNE